MAFLTVIIFVSLILISVVWKTVGSRSKIPKGLKPLPGPKGYPIIGSVPEVPEKNSFIKFHEWGIEYGPIYQVDLAGTNHVWISTDRIAHETLSKKSAIYSDRPHIPAVIDDNRTSAQYLPLLSKNDAWVRQRKFGNSIFRESHKAVYYHYPELEAKRLLVELMESPYKYNHHLESFVSRVTCRLAWGHSEASDELKQRARELLIGVSPTGALGNKIPFIMSLPDWLSPAKAWERRRAKTERRFFEIMQGEVEHDMKEKKAPSSWMRHFLEFHDNWGHKYDLEGAYMVGMHGIAGALTIAAPMQTFCLAMSHYPQYQGLLYEELDRVCGDRLPRSEDRPNLPVLRAFIRESMRWRPPVPTGIPHYCTQDDVYEGYHIPKGSVMHPLEWSISRERSLYPDPEEFNPNRWLKPEYPTYKEPLTAHPTILNIPQFGYGTRICMGQKVADEDLLIGIGSLAWLFKIVKSKCSSEENNTGSHGKEDLTDEKYPILSNQPSSRMTTETEKTPLEKQDVAAPGSFPRLDPMEEKDQLKRLEKKLAEGKVDPTLDYSPLLIAKPLPFQFELIVRDEKRANIARQEYEKEHAKGSYINARAFWEEGGELGWGKV